jgi:hypothetical protein
LFDPVVSKKMIAYNNIEDDGCIVSIQKRLPIIKIGCFYKVSKL